jgi:hypothetical protein
MSTRLIDYVIRTQAATDPTRTQDPHRKWRRLLVNKKTPKPQRFFSVGATGFEPVTSAV